MVKQTIDYKPYLVNSAELNPSKYYMGFEQIEKNIYLFQVNEKSKSIMIHVNQSLKEYLTQLQIINDCMKYFEVCIESGLRTEQFREYYNYDLHLKFI